MNAIAAAGSAQSLWFLSRGSGLVLLTLFSLIVTLGVATAGGSASRRWPRFAVAELHRTFSLFGLALLALHVVTATLDPFVTIGWAATVLPFVSPYRTAAIDAGTLAVDLAGAVLVTSLLRRRLKFRTWRVVHWLAYLAWPAAFAHSLTAGNDLRVWWVGLVEWACAALVGTAVLARVLNRSRADRSGQASRSQRVPSAVGPRILTGSFDAAPASLAEHLARHRALPARLDREGVQALIAEIGLAGLTGRGGAGFPAARKLAAVAAAGGRPVVVANGTEGEPASAKDKVLAATQPHLVLDGAAVVAAIVSAPVAFIVVDAVVAQTMETAVAEREAMRLDQARLRVVTAADGFVAGEASAVVGWIERGIAAPRPVPPRLAESGLHGQPTLVHNIETLAHVALIARYGASWFRAVGTRDEPGSMLVTLVGAVRDPGVREIELGRPVKDVLALAGGLDRRVDGLLLGGYSGWWVRWPAVADLPFSVAGLAPASAGPGAGLIAALPADRCPLAETARIANYLAAESAGQCGPCVFGLSAISAELTALAHAGTGDPQRIRRWLGQVEGRGACRHPDGAARMIRSALEVFGEEVSEHASGWCTGTRESPVLPLPDRRPRWSVAPS